VLAERLLAYVGQLRRHALAAPASLARLADHSALRLSDPSLSTAVGTITYVLPLPIVSPLAPPSRGLVRQSVGAPMATPIHLRDGAISPSNRRSPPIPPRRGQGCHGGRRCLAAQPGGVERAITPPPIAGSINAGDAETAGGDKPQAAACDGDQLELTPALACESAVPRSGELQEVA